MKIIQQYSAAVVSSNLKDDAHHHQTEVLGAVAMSGELASDLFRTKYSLQAKAYDSLLASWKIVVKTKAVTRQWPREVSANKVARLSLDYWLNDVCTYCVGKGHLRITTDTSGRGTLSDDPCPGCNGTAKRPIDVKPQMIVKYVTEMVESLEATAISAGGKAIMMLGDGIDFP